MITGMNKTKMQFKKIIEYATKHNIIIEKLRKVCGNNHRYDIQAGYLCNHPDMKHTSRVCAYISCPILRMLEEQEK